MKSKKLGSVRTVCRPHSCPSRKPRAAHFLVNGPSGPVLQFLALFVSVVFLVLAVLFIWTRLHEVLTWQQIAFFEAYVLGAGLLFAGSVLWNGWKPWLARIAGFILLLIFPAYNRALIPILFPMLPIAVFSLGRHEGERRWQLPRLSGPAMTVLVCAAIALAALMIVIPVLFYLGSVHSFGALWSLFWPFDKSKNLQNS